MRRCASVDNLTFSMSKMLESAIAKIRKLPETLQDKAAERLLVYVDEMPSGSERVSIDDVREAYANGDFITLAKWRRDLGLADD
jgi:hypothetical protein